MIIQVLLTVISSIGVVDAASLPNAQALCQCLKKMAEEDSSADSRILMRDHECCGYRSSAIQYAVPVSRAIDRYYC